MSITLPTSPAPKEIDIVPVDTVGRLTGGGADLRVIRSGERNAAIVTLPPMSAADALSWQTDLRARGDTVVLNIPEPGITIGTPGTPLVKGAGQTGNSLIIDGFVAGYTIPKGKWIAVPVSGLLYAYQNKAAVVANGSGEATLTFHQPLRASPADNAAVSFNPAKIEGFVELPDGALKLTVDRLMAGCTFTIRERR